MKKAILKWNPDEKGIRFEMLDDDLTPIDTRLWGQNSVTHENGTGNVSAILSLLNDDVITNNVSSVILSHEQIAGLTDIEIRQLGLPPAAPFRLQVRGKGQLARPDFSLDYTLLTSRGIPAIGLNRQGALCSFAGKQYTLLEPLYALITGIEKFEKTSFDNIDDQMVAWGHLQKLLPDNALVDNQLKTVTIVRADQFTLDIEEDGRFSPLLLHTETTSLEGQQGKIAPVLPEIRHTKFSEQFKKREHPRKHYSVGAGWYLVISSKLQKALQVVRNAQKLDSNGRKAFLANPAAHIREYLLPENYSDEQEQEIETLFHETKNFLSDRIICLGEWQPKLCAYRVQSEHKWLPEEDLLYNIISDDKIYQLSLGQAKKILPKIKRAANNNESEAEIEGVVYPVTPELIQSLEKITTVSKHKEKAQKKTKSEQPVPILIDNIESEEFTVVNKDPRGQSYGGIPGILKTQPLFRHQLNGLKWMQEHWAKGSPGGLLADDMGLGKTLQALTFLAWVAEAMDNDRCAKKPFLVVAPTGLLKNWQDEAAKHLFFPGLGRMVEGCGKRLKQFKNMTLLQRRNQFNSADWVLTTYETLRDKINYFLPVEWGVTIFDEAQKIKNPVSRMTEMAKSIDSDFTLILTGTPVENELKDLWCIVDTALPGFLGSLKNFHTQYAKPAKENLEVAVDLQKRLLNETTPPVMLRRMKEDHLQGLPEKRISVRKVQMPKKQARRYSEIIFEANANKGEKGAMLKALQGLRNCSLSASEIDSEGLTDAIVTDSARLSATIEILDLVHKKGEKALIFLESLDLQELMIPYLQNRYEMSRPPFRISGKISGTNRKKNVDIFQNGMNDGLFDVMILSPKAGGVGLTLTAANHVIHLSRWWNPAVEDQCTDRIYRIGQEKTVHVYYPLAIHPEIGAKSFDQNLHNLLEIKRDLSRKVLLPPSFTSQDYSLLFSNSLGAQN